MRFITDGLTGQFGLGVDDKGVFAPVRPRGFAPRNRLCSSDARGGAAAAGQAARHLLKALTRVLNLKATLPSAANLGPQRVEALHDLPTTWPSVVKASFERTRDPLHYKPFTAPEEARLQQIYPGAHGLVGCVGGRGWGGGGGGGTLAQPWALWCLLSQCAGGLALRARAATSPPFTAPPTRRRRDQGAGGGDRSAAAGRQRVQGHVGRRRAGALCVPRAAAATTAPAQPIWRVS